MNERSLLPDILALMNIGERASDQPASANGVHRWLACDPDDLLTSAPRTGCSRKLADIFNQCEINQSVSSGCAPRPWARQFGSLWALGTGGPEPAGLSRMARLLRLSGPSERADESSMTSRVMQAAACTRSQLSSRLDGRHAHRSSTLDHEPAADVSPCAPDWPA